MRLLFVITSPISIILLRGQIKFNKDKGAQVYLATAYDKSIDIEIIKEGFFYRKIDLVREISLIKDFLAVINAYKILKEVKPNIINASTPKAGLIFMLASCLVKGVYPIFTLRGMRSDTLNGLKYYIVWFTEFLTCTFAKKVVVISPSLRDHAIKTKIVRKNKTIVIGKGSSNGINIEKFTKTNSIVESANQIRDKYNIPLDAFVFGFIGRIVEDKGIVEMFQAFKEVKARKENVFLVITGSIESDNSVSKSIMDEMYHNPYVVFTGFTNEVPVMLSSYDVLVLFSHREGFGNVVLQAASMEIPAIVADIPGLKDTVEEGVTGFKVESKNHSLLAEKMLFCYTNKDVVSSLGANARKRAVDYFSSDIIWQELFKIYRQSTDV